MCVVCLVVLRSYGMCVVCCVVVLCCGVCCMLCVVLWCVVYCVTVLLLLLSVSCLVMRLGCLILLCDFLVVRLSCGGVALSYLVVVLRLTSHILPFLLFCSLSLSFPFTRYILFSGVLPQAFSPMPGVLLQRCRHPLYQSPEQSFLSFLPSFPASSSYLRPPLTTHFRAS